MSLQPKQAHTFEDYLAAERAGSDVKHEYVAGEVFAMTGATFEHNLIALNIAAELRNRLKGMPCTVQTADMRVRIVAAEAGTYPDVVVVCGEPAFHDNRRDTLTNATLIVEVLSPSTEGYDRGNKFALYRALPGLRHYAVVAQDRVSVDVFTRDAEGRWVLTAYDRLDETVVLDAIGCTLPVAEVYDKVDPAALDWTPPDPEERR